MNEKEKPSGHREQRLGAVFTLKKEEGMHKPPRILGHVQKETKAPSPVLPGSPLGGGGGPQFGVGGRQAPCLAPQRDRYRGQF